MRLVIRRTGIVLAALASLAARPAGAAPAGVVVTSFRGAGTLPVLTSQDWSAPLPDVTRAVITLHGVDGDAATYDRIAHTALDKAGRLTGEASDHTLLITPRFIQTRNVGALSRDALPGNVLRWDDEGWMAGAMATAPAALSSFEAMDAILARLSDRTLFPSLRIVVLAGHSGGAQFVQRYAILNHGSQTLTQRGIAIRYIVANPSSYAYFSPDRPTASGGFAPYPLDTCHRFDDWKYGLRNLPPYASDAPARAWERDYAATDVTYLLGTDDTGTDLPDRSCAAAAEGPTRYARGQAYFRYLQRRDGAALHQQLHDIPGVGHDAQAMLISDCSVAAIYDAPVCGNAPAAALPVVISMPVAAPVAHPVVSHRPPARPHKPPPPLHEARPEPLPAGFVWQPGTWVWSGSGYVWVGGHYVQPGRVYTSAGWQWGGAGWIWRPGG